MKEEKKREEQLDMKEEEEDENTPLLTPKPNSSPPPKQEITHTTLLSSTTTTIVEDEEEAKSVRNQRSVQTKVPEVEVHLYCQGKGPISVFKSPLGGWDQDQLEVRDILEQYGFKSIFAFHPNDGGRTVPIRFHPKNGRSILPYKDGSVIYVDGEPKDSLIKPITRIVVGVAVITILIAVVVIETPVWAEKYSLKGMRIPPWVITCVVIVFTRMRKRTKDFFKNRGWC